MRSGLEVSFADGPAHTPAHPLPELIEQLLIDSCPIDTFENELLEDGGIEALATWYALRPSLERDRRLCYRVLRADQPMLAFIPAAGLASTIESTPHTVVRLSRFAHIRRDGDTLILDSPCALGRVELHSPRALEIVARLVTARAADAIAKELQEDAAWIAGVVGLLLSAGFVLLADGDGTTTEDRNAQTTSWEFHDLVFHERSRPFRTDRPVGATNRFGSDAIPAGHASGGDQSERQRIALYRPDLSAIARKDLPFTRVLEARRSRRFHAETPITAKQLGEFLFRTMRATRREDDDATSAARFRLYPGGGACHPLETYVFVARCDGLEPGLYRYLAEDHALAPIACEAAAVQSMIQRSAVPMERGSAQQLQLVLTARFSRINRRYEGNAYALVLQEVGAVHQTMYLVATAMALAGCAVGGGDANAFARLIGTDPLEESSVGAFVLGSA